MICSQKAQKVEEHRGKTIADCIGCVSLSFADNSSERLWDQMFAYVVYQSYIAFEQAIPNREAKGMPVDFD